MPLTLTVLRCPDAVPPETRTVTGGEFSVGRGPGVDWVLPDPERLLSKRHFMVAYRSGAWQIADTSTNGTTLNREAAPIGRETVRTLRDGDRLSMGAYEIEVRLADEAVSQPGLDAGFRRSPAVRDASPFGDPFAMDPLAPPPAPRHPFGEPPDRFGLSPGPAQLPHDFDPLAPDPNAAPFLGPTQEDHRPVLEDAFRPQSIGQPLPNAGGRLPADALLPQDWEKDLLSGIRPPAALSPAIAQPPRPPMPPQAPAMPPPAAAYGAPPGPARAAVQSFPAVPPPVQPRAAAPAAVQPPAPLDPFAELGSGPALAEAEQPDAAALPPTPFDQPFDLQPQPEIAAPPVSNPVPPASHPVPAQAAEPSPPTATDAALLAAFLQGAKMTDVRPDDPAATMRHLGAAFRALVSGLRAVLIARASIKNEFRIEQTMIRPRGNNPLKFAAGDDDALAGLLGAGRRTDMTAAHAVADALRDIKLHELATMTAMQTAVRTLLQGLDPAALRAQAEQAGGLSVLPAQRKARAWDAYEALYARTTQALADDFDSLFGKAFARAYERALDDIAAEDK